ncbi:MAG: ORF6C domain-containing protein [Lachnospira sp.]|jgi:prophage antirepressor-like protein|nr:ORF6C domain-containing protein [Lachnospira sp.]
MADTNLQVFNSEEFGNVRTVIVNNDPMFCLIDVCRALEIGNVSQLKTRLNQGGVIINEVIDSLGRKQKATFINESNLYKTIFQSRKANAEKFTDWVTSEVLPTIRKAGSYNMNMTDEEKIRLIAKGNVKLNERIDKVEDKISSLENDMPLYGCEIDEVQKHIKRKVVDVLGGKNTSAYKDSSVRSSVFADIYRQLKREYGCVSTYKSIKRKYIADVHDFIDCYLPPTVLLEQITNSNAQMCISF